MNSFINKAADRGEDGKSETQNYSRFSITLLFLLIGLMLFQSGPAAAAEQGKQRSYKQALPGYVFRFPDDHFSHDEYKTEWWYYTGHLQSERGKKLGFELTFFRSGVPIEDGVKDGPWSLKNVYMSHFALSNISSGRFQHFEKLCRSGPDAAGAKENEYKVWTENWSADSADKSHVHHLKAAAENCAVDLFLKEGKAPCIHGSNGISQKASCKGCASHYYSYTRMPLSGTVTLDGRTEKVSGVAWMDHEFGSNQLTAEQIGWDWYSIQLEDGTDLMLYLMRLKKGGFDPNSSGTIIESDGKTRQLPLSSYQLKTCSYWKSPHTGAKYPSKWRVSLPGEKLDLVIEPEMADQELASKRGGISYWEGSCSVSGSKQGKPIKGQAYVELTGYAADFKEKI